MTAEFSGFIPPREEVERINDKAADTVRRLTEEVCAEATQTVYEGIKVHLQADEDLMSRMEAGTIGEGSTLPTYVLQDLLTAPRIDGSFMFTYSLRLEPPETADFVGDESYMRIHIPSSDTNIATVQADALPDSSEVYIEQMSNGEQHWFALSDKKIYEYIPKAQQDSGDDNVLSDSGIWRWINERIPESMETASSLLRDIVNWETTPQRYITIGKTDTLDV